MGSQRVRVQSLLNDNDAPQYSPSPGNQHAHTSTQQAEMTTRNGRQYLTRYVHAYPYPCDDRELARLDMLSSVVHFHCLGGRMTLANFGARRNQARILDVGCGTGWWVIGIADANEKITVTGFDIARTMPPPEIAASNAEFFAPWDLASQNWPIEPESYDLIRHAQLLGSVSDWSQYFRTAYAYIRPGGWYEGMEMDWFARYDERPNQHDLQAFQQWYQDMDAATRQIRKPFAYDDSMGIFLRQAGFVDVRHRKYRLNCGARAREYYSSEGELKLATEMMEGVQNAMGYHEGAPWSGMSMELFTRYLNYSPEDVEDLGSRLCDAVNRPRNPFYFEWHVWTARKPLTPMSRH
ncbi:S-adenosyl-L-methionine-dependent methyltransferase [Teratosphaeria nubilosa]|uniref:S-adenosyl-L-methionine-dependent methyltransferase n=1 Tax=Teratosphaeria nubilosa TaxID=161662 RepID=A0A6G1KYT8_9PEZI|nr:S-adenosyl-L-methionine-dependent methyltransferase [Teratosphaeria nubilosa]